MKLRKALCLLLSMALILSIGMPGTLAIEASGDDTTPETTETTASTEGAEEKNESPTNAVAEATTGSVTAEETEEVHDGPTELAITEGAEEDNNESAESVTEETTEATTTEDTVAELESSEPENPPASFGTSLGSGSVAVGDTIWIKSGSQTYKQPDTASVSREVLFNYQTKILSVITDDTGDVWYEFEPTGLLQLFSDYKYVRIESTSVEEPTAPEETEDGNDCTCGDTALEDLSKHADSCPRKQYVLGLIKNETGNYKTAAEIHANWVTYDGNTETDILNIVQAYVPTEYDALVALIKGDTIPSCDCQYPPESGLLAEHADSCALKQYCNALLNGPFTDLCNEWEQLPKMAQVYLWGRLSDEDRTTLISMGFRDPTVPDEELKDYSETFDVDELGISVSIQGQVPTGAAVSVAKSDNSSAKLTALDSILPGGQTIILNISVFDQSGNMWKPEDGSPVTVTISMDGVYPYSNIQVRHFIDTPDLIGSSGLNKDSGLAGAFPEEAQIGGGTVYYERCPVTVGTGTITFSLSSFSNVAVTNATITPPTDTANWEVDPAAKTVKIHNESGLRSWADSMTTYHWDYDSYTVTLTSDIALTGEWIPIRARTDEDTSNGGHNTLVRGMTFDGCGHTISNMTITQAVHSNNSNSTGSNRRGAAGFFGAIGLDNTSQFPSLTIKNLKFETVRIVNITNADDLGGKSELSCGVVIGSNNHGDNTIALTVSLENISVNDVVITVGGEIGGLIGRLQTNKYTKASTFSNCSVTNAFLGNYDAAPGTYIGLNVGGGDYPTKLYLNSCNSVNVSLYYGGTATPVKKYYVGYDYSASGVNTVVDESTQTNTKAEYVYPVHFYDTNGKLVEQLYLTVDPSKEQLPEGEWYWSADDETQASENDFELGTSFSKISKDFSTTETLSFNKKKVSVTTTGAIALYQHTPATIAITINKIIQDGKNPDQDFIFSISGNGVSMQAVIFADSFQNGKASITISGLPAGTYTVKEESNWSWRYTPNTQQQNTNGEDAVTFTNTRNQVKWLDCDMWCKNIYGQSIPEKKKR